MMIILYSLFIFLYSILILKLCLSWQRIGKKSWNINNIQAGTFISVIIPVRNESENILQLLYDLNKQKLSSNQFEVIVVNDDSTDDTIEKILGNRMNFKFQLKICHLKVEEGFKGSHKKRALTLGIENSKGDYIVTTDGDCRVPTQWLSTLKKIITEQNPACITGPVTFEKENTLFKDMQIMEFAFLIGTGASSLHMGFPNMCNGANLSFSKKAFLEVKGYEDNTHIPSGDDEFLMHKIFKKYPGKVYFLKSKNFIVTTKAKDDFKSLFYQRRRWAGKWKLYSDIKISLFAAFYFIFNLIFFAIFILVMFGKYPVEIFLLQTIIRFIIDFIFLKSIMKFLNQQFSLSLFFLAEILYPFYIIVLGIASNFGNYEWKGRKLG